MADMTEAAAVAAVRAAYARVRRVRVTLLTEEGAEVLVEEFAVRPGDTLSYRLPLPADVKVSDA